MSSVANSRGPILPVRLAHALSQITEGVPNPWDESDDYFTPFYVPFDDTTTVNAETLRSALKVGKRYRLDIAEPNLIEVADNWGDGGADYRLLDAILKATLTELMIVRARGDGVVRVRTWLLGRFKGWLVGLKTTSTET